MNTNPIHPFLLFLLFNTLTLISCGQEQPHKPTITVQASKPDLPNFPPVAQDNVDRSAWKEKAYGKPSVLLITIKELPNTGERVPDEARSYIVFNDTWAGNLGSDFQVVLNLIEYQPTVNLDLLAISQFAVKQFNEDEANSNVHSKPSSITIPGTEDANRLDGILSRDGLIHYWCIVTAKLGQRVWQLHLIYPETYAAGPGDVDAILQSMRLAK